MRQLRFIHRTLPICLAVCTIFAASLIAQLSTGKVEGIVRDQDTGAPLAGAQVTVEGTRLGNITNSDGYYFILNIPPGLRTIDFSYTGYQKISVSSQMILAGQTTTVDAMLSSTVLQLEGIVVEGQSDILVPRDNTVTKQRLTSEKLEQTPASRLEDLMILEAGVQIGGEGSAARGLRIRGGRLGEEGMVVDGVMVRNYTADLHAGGMWNGAAEDGMLAQDATPLELAISSVEQVDIITGGFQAEYGNAQSGIVSIVTKEGGPRLNGNVRFTTDQQNPRTSDYGYNQLSTNLGGPVFNVPNLYFHVSGEIQGAADTDPTHAGEGFRGVNQAFVDRLNAAVAEDPILSLPENAFTLEEFQRGREFYAGKTGKNASLYSPPNPVRLPGNWNDRTLVTGKLTWSPLQGLKLFASENWSRNQRSYPSGPNGDGNYFLTGIVDRNDPVVSRQLPFREWGNESTLYIPQSRGRRVRTSNLITGFDWDVLRSASHSASLQFRYSYLSTGEAPGSDLAKNFSRDTFLSWSPHDLLFEVETYPNRDNPPDGEESRYFPNGLTDYLGDWGYESPFATDYDWLYVLSYSYLHERQNNFKVDLDMQVDRHNRFKTGIQMNVFDNFKYTTNFNTHITENRSIDYSPRIMALYAQNRMDLGDFVFDMGLRYDEFRPGSNWGLSPFDQFAEAYFPKNVREFSPRFDVAFPVTDKSQLRFSYGTFKQLPGLSVIFSSANYGDLEYSSTDAFEGGFSYLISPNVIFDLVAYNRDIDGNLADATVFRDIYLYHSEMQSRGWVTTLANRSAGNIKGMDLTLKKRFSNNFALDLLYTMQFSRAQAGSPGTSYAGDELRPNDGDRTHQLATILNYMFPTDFMAGNFANRILGDTRFYTVFSLNSGQPVGSGDLANLVRTGWNYNLDLRGSKNFNLGANRRVNLFVEVFNLLNTKTNQAYPKGSAYKYEPNSHTTGGVEWKWDDVASTDGSVRFNADFNQDGVLSLMESTKGEIANRFMLDTMDKRGWGRARQIRTGLELNF